MTILALIAANHVLVIVTVVVLASGISIRRRQDMKRRSAAHAPWKRAVYNPKEFRRQR
jgi:hypothetical protein